MKKTIQLIGLFTMLFAGFFSFSTANPVYFYPGELEGIFAPLEDGVPYKAGWDKAKVIGIAKGSRPNPSEYLPSWYIQIHQEAFANGASYLVPKSVLDKYGRAKLGRPDGQFVMSKNDMDWAIANANGRLSDIETQLGIPAGAWAGKEIVRIDIKDVKALHLRIPTGNEAGANDLWLPGGKLPTGFWEAVVDQISQGQYTETLLNLK